MKAEKYASLEKFSMEFAYDTFYGYIAAINVLGTPMLFSTAPLSQFFVLGTSGDKNSVDKHHIFLKHYLEQIGYENDRDRNQIANFTYFVPFLIILIPVKTIPKITQGRRTTVWMTVEK